MMALCAEEVRVAVKEAGRRERVILDVPHLRVEPGESLGVTGPSGGGKTTLLHALAGLHSPGGGLHGRIFWNSQALHALSEAGRDALRARLSGMVFQDFQLVGGLSALDNVLLPTVFRRWRPGAEQRRRALELLERLGLGHPHTRAEKLSRGEMQRVALARAFLGECAVLFADEPTASLDAAAAHDVAVMLLELCRERGSTLICVTHDAVLAERFDRRIRLVDGQTHAEAAASESGSASPSDREAA